MCSKMHEYPGSEMIRGTRMRMEMVYKNVSYDESYGIRYTAMGIYYLAIPCLAKFQLLAHISSTV